MIIKQQQTAVRTLSLGLHVKTHQDKHGHIGRTQMLAIIYLTECISQPDKSRKIHNSFRETGVSVGETFNLNEKNPEI